jgi:hypothetical protein
MMFVACKLLGSFMVSSLSCPVLMSLSKVSQLRAVHHVLLLPLDMKAMVPAITYCGDTCSFHVPDISPRGLWWRRLQAMDGILKA